MQWFKHYADARTSTGLQYLTREYGLVAYAWYFIIVELCTAKWTMQEDNWTQCEFKFHVGLLSSELRLQSARVQPVLNQFSTRAIFLSTRVEDHFIIKFTNLLKFLDRDTKYTRNKRVTNASKTRLEKEKEKEKEEEISILLKPGSDAAQGKRRRAPASPDGFADAYALFPRKVGRSRGEKLYAKTVLTPQDREALLLAIARYKGHIAENHTEGKYIMHFSTFMGQWRDWCAVDAGSSEGFKEKTDLEILMEDEARGPRIVC